MSKGMRRTSICWATRGGPSMGETAWPQVGQHSRTWSKGGLVSCSGEKAARECLGWPGCPPCFRLSWPGGGGGLGGLTMSEEGGLEEVEESLRALASFSCKERTCSVKEAMTCCCCSSSPRSVCTCSCSRWQLGQEVVVS